MQKNQGLIYVLLTVFGLAVAFTYHFWQPPNNFADNPLADANEYLKIYDHFKNSDAPYFVRQGIHQRIAVPWLASLLPGDDAATNFFLINSFFAIISLPLLYYFLGFFTIIPAYRLAVLLYFSLHWAGPFRQNAIDPVNGDMPMYLFEMALFIFIVRRRYIWLLLLAPLAVAVKELALAYLLATLVYVIFFKVVYKDRTHSLPWILAIVLAGLTTNMLINLHFPSPASGITPLHVMAFHFRENILHPDYPIRWVLSLFAALGAFLFLPWLKVFSKGLDDPDKLLGFLAICALALSWLGGMDYTRLIFLGFPWIIAFILSTGRPGQRTFFTAFGLSILLSRFWMALPVIGTDLSPYSPWMPENASVSWLFVWAATAIVSFILMLVALRFERVHN